MKWWKYILIIGVVLTVDALIIEPYSLKISTYDLKNPQLSGLKIVFATDFHIAPYAWEKWRLNRVIKAINKQNADLVILGGDYVNRHSRKSTMLPSEIAAKLQEINAVKVAVLGNHDSYYGKQEVKQALEDVAIPVLDNNSTKINLQGKEVYIAGVSDYDTNKPDIAKAMENTKSPLIFITHSPDVFSNLKGEADIAFAGHTHGGQIVLPLWGALVINTDSGRKYAYGLIYENDTPHIVSSGFGTSILPLRFNNRPEIVAVTFK